jgi:hypothetical protein
MKLSLRICIPASDIIDGNLGDGVEEILGLSGGKWASKRLFNLTERAIVVPVVVVATKFDTVVSQVSYDMAGKGTQSYEETKAAAHERFERSCRSVFPRNLRDVPVETSSGIIYLIHVTWEDVLTHSMVYS